MQNRISYETISQSFGSSFTIRHFDKNAQNILPVWHLHPELELVYIKGGNGRRHIGSHQSYYRDGDLILLGSNLPHNGFTEPQSKNEAEIVIQFNQDFLGKDFMGIPETRRIEEMFSNADYGLLFSSNVKNEIGPKIEALIELTPFKRLLAFIKILQELANNNEYKLLNEEKWQNKNENVQNKQLDSIFGIVRKNFHVEISLESVADYSNMTIPAFCRYFKKQSGKTFTQFVNEYRIIHARKLLSESSKMITEIAEESGYKNFSHFNRQFNKFTGKTPSQYRKEFRKLIQ